MKKSEIELFVPFYNQNGHLSIAYRVDYQKIFICNYNGSFYTLVSDDKTIKYTDAEISTDMFFQNFPERVINNENRLTYNTLKNNYFIRKGKGLFDKSYKVNTNLLLII